MTSSQVIFEGKELSPKSSQIYEWVIERMKSIEWTPSRDEGFLDRVNDHQLEHMMWMVNSKVILIDNINFVNAVTFATMDFRFRQITGVAKPFGGLSVIVFGDFHQLPPVGGNGIFEGLPNELLDKFKTECPESPENLGIEGFDIGRDLSLEEVVKDYIALCKANPDLTFAILATSAVIVKDLNDSIIEKTDGFRCYPAEDPIENRYPKKGLLADMNLMIAVGCPVILTCNLSNFSLKNGTQGVVESLNDNEIFVKFPSGIFPLRREVWTDQYNRKRWSQFPIRAAHAHTIERSQGMHFDGVIVVRNKEWDQNGLPIWDDDFQDQPGELYTALSRARNLDLCYATPRKPSFVVSKENFDEARQEIALMSLASLFSPIL
uniref:ATP-dependent DNA helicase n=1 Tax=Caenorhabditis tropicalis TaxID=1561998 RepID=A0A1I7SZE0_9PELO